MIQKIITILAELQPLIATHDGRIEFVKYEDHILYVRLHGACQGCVMVQYTLRQGILERMVQEIPEMRDVRAVE